MSGKFCGSGTMLSSGAGPSMGKLHASSKSLSAGSTKLLTLNSDSLIFCSLAFDSIDMKKSNSSPNIAGKPIIASLPSISRTIKFPVYMNVLLAPMSSINLIVRVSSSLVSTVLSFSANVTLRIFFLILFPNSFLYRSTRCKLM